MTIEVIEVKPRRGRSRTSRPVTTQEVYGKIANLQATLFQMRGERLARAERGDFGVSPTASPVRKSKARCLSPVTRWKSRGRSRTARGMERPNDQASPDRLREVLRSVSRGRKQLSRDREERRSLSRGRDILKEVRRSASSGRSMSKKEQDESVVSPGRQSKASGTSKRSKVSMGMTMAERTKLRLEERERKLERIKHEMMKDCTFTPETNHSSSAATSTNRSIYSRGSYGSRLTKASRNTPKKQSNIQNSPSGTTIHTPPTLNTTPSEQGFGSNRASPQSLGNSAETSRIQELYLDGIRRNRAFTDKTEAEMRKRRLEEKELAQCTFKPNMDWRKKTQPQPKPQQGGVGYNPRVTSMRDDGSAASMGTLTLCSVNDMPPVEIVTQDTTGFVTPPQVTIVVGDLGVENYLSKDDVKKSLGPEFEAARSVDTEYGSI